MCPKCAGPQTDVVDSRPAQGYIRRRRLCADCKHKFTTHERWTPEGALFFKALALAQALEQMEPDRTRLIDDLIGMLAKETT